MVFSSLTFLLLFLPFALLAYRFMKGIFWKNLFLLVISLLFYTWGEPGFVILLILSCLFNYISGILVGRTSSPFFRKLFLTFAISVNLLGLIYFKYINFLIENLNVLFFEKYTIALIPNVVLPIGISFYTFQALSYVVDVYRRNVEVEKNFINVALYVSFFPQLIAGPIVKFHDVNLLLRNRALTMEKTAYGIKRFIYGLGKKVIIANCMAVVADEIFALSNVQLNFAISWLGIVCYSLQIYYDFSGYSDMAIGLGKMFGFDFLENFNYPYIACSIKDFWRRWHISLSTWFKEYLYIPLGGNRCGRFRQSLNLGVVFLATGIWHGASWNFVLWGMLHGILIIVENLFLKNILEMKKLKIFSHLYVILMFMIGWVFFRVEKLSDSLIYIRKMFSFRSDFEYDLLEFISPFGIFILFAGILLSGPVQNIFPKLKERLFCSDAVRAWEIPALGFIFIFSFLTLAAGTYNPFIYFRF